MIMERSNGHEHKSDYDEIRPLYTIGLCSGFFGVGSNFGDPHIKRLQIN